MKILGICHDVLICSACVISDGRIVSAMPEERIDRVKQSRGFPRLAVDACLKQAGMTIEEIDEIAVGWNPGIELETIPSGYLNSRRWRTEHLMQVPGQILNMNKAQAVSQLSLHGLFKNCPPITYVDHYLAHVGNALYLSPFSSTAILILDGRGERRTGLLAKANGAELEILDQIDFPHSIGLFYGAITEFLGFKPDSDEWKVMSLASYAEWDNPYYPVLSKMIEIDDSGRFQLDLQFFEFYNFWDRRMFSDKLISVLGEPRKKDGPLEERHALIAAAAQKVFEDKVSEILFHLHRRTSMDRVVLSGGCFMNSVFNGKIAALTPFKESFITSCPDDSGTSVGAALYLNALRTGGAGSNERHNFWGLEYSDDVCAEIASNYKLPNRTIVSDPAEAAAEDIRQGKLVGWFQGRAEFGQRALGNRSILADPRKAEMKEKINSAVKFREAFRPFAPSILLENAAEYFRCPDHQESVPYMERVFKFHDEFKGLVPAVVHVDGTGRLQTVEKQSSGRYRDLIENFHVKTGVPLVLNTSFNLNGEPIVNSPDHAIRTFYSCGLDVLYLGNVRIMK